MEAPALAGESWTSVQRKAVDLKMGFIALDLPIPALKRITKIKPFPER